jgi:glycosyltransferase involved in cell wall biosynthesis
LRIALDVSIRSASQPTGVERAQEVLVDGLLAHCPEHELVLLGGEGLPARWAEHDRVTAAAEGRGLLWRHTLLPSALQRERADLLHSPVAALPRRAPCPTLASLHELPWAEPGAPGDRSLFHRWAAAFAARRAALLVCPSERTAQQAARMFPEARSRLRVVPHGVDPRFADAHVSAEQRAGLAALGIPDPGDYVLAVGRLRTKKNLTALVEAWREVWCQLPRDDAPAALVLSGPEGDASDSLRRAATSSASAPVVLPGFIPDELMPALVQGARVLAAPSLLEGFGLTPLEAMAAGVPVLASRQGPVTEAVGDAALVVDGTSVPALAEGLRRLLCDEQERARCVEAGRAHAGARSAEAMARAVSAVYQELSSGELS